MFTQGRKDRKEDHLYNSEVGEFFHFKLVIPAKAGIQKRLAEKTGCPPQPVPAQAGAGMTVITPRSFLSLNLAS
jgi:hypothetical protein